MRRMLKKAIAAMLAVATVATPARAYEDSGKLCPTYDQVESNATGGDYVGGILIYETMGTVSRSGADVTTTTSTTVSGEVGVPGDKVGGSVTTTVVATQPGTTVTTEEPIGYYKMNDGSIYQINCLTGDATKLS